MREGFYSGIQDKFLAVVLDLRIVANEKQALVVSLSVCEEWNIMESLGNFLIIQGALEESKFPIRKLSAK